MLRHLTLTLLSIFAAIPAIADVETAPSFTTVDYEIAFTRVDVAGEISLPTIELFEPETRLTLFPSNRKLASGSSTSLAGTNYLEQQELSAKSWQGHDYMHARYYSPVMGRFLSVDPKMTIKKNLSQPQRWNRYSYVTNNPLGFVDPDGEEGLRVAQQLDQDVQDLLDGKITREEYMDRIEARAAGGGIGVLAVGAAVYGPGVLAAATPQLMRWGIPMTPVFNFLRNIGAAQTGQPSLPFGLSQTGMKHATKHLSQFQELDKSMTQTKLIGLAGQIASKAENYLSSPGGRANYEQIVKIGDQFVKVRVVINEAGNLRSVHIRYQ